MRTLLVLAGVASVLAFRSTDSPAQEEKLPVTLSSQELSRPGEDHPWDREIRPDSELGSRDLWYGTPGVRPGGDLLGPIIDLVKDPSGLLDFRPRKVSTYLPDRDTAEFLRDRR